MHAALMLLPNPTLASRLLFWPASSVTWLCRMLMVLRDPSSAYSAQGIKGVSIHETSL